MFVIINRDVVSIIETMVNQSFLRDCILDYKANFCRSFVVDDAMYYQKTGMQLNYRSSFTHEFFRKHIFNFLLKTTHPVKANRILL